MALSLFRNPLSFPTGVAPGFDPTHRAAKTARFSGIAAGGGGFVNLLTGKPAPMYGAPTQVIDGTLGLATKFVDASGQYGLPTGFPVVIDNNVTFAAIISISATSNSAILQSGTSLSNGWEFSVNALVLNLTACGVASISSGITLALNTPYFVAATYGANGTSFLVKNLLTGATTTATSGATYSSYVSQSTYIIGGEVGSTTYCFNGLISAAMFSATTLRLNELLAWSDDPWAYWYPDNDNILSVQTTSVPYALALDSGAYVLSGSPASLVAARNLALASGAYALGGFPATFQKGRGLPLATGAYALSGSAATLTYTPGSHASYTLALHSGSYLLSGSSASLVAVVANLMDMHDGGGGKKKPRPLPWTKEDEARDKARRAALDAAEEARREKPSESVRAAVEAAVAAQKPKIDAEPDAPAPVALKVNAGAKQKVPTPKPDAPLGKIAVAKQLAKDMAREAAEAFDDDEDDAITALLLTL